MIDIGDYVEVAYPTICCGNKDGIGQKYIVSNLYYGESICNYCGEISSIALADEIGEEDSEDIRRLRKLPPLIEPITKTEKEPIKV